jgi:D-beta-D-heptose 7-phosphate kinase/D-beta-D-heptose 1-phosphate adenosyltransferase
MIRIDREDTSQFQAAAVDGLCAGLERALEQASALIISDYAKGAVSLGVMDRVRDLCRTRGIPWIVDPKPSQMGLYQGATAMTPNTKELSELSGMAARGDAELTAAGQKLVDALGLQGLLVTRSEKGMAVFAPDLLHRAPWLIPTEAREVFDVSGAGDTVIAVFSAALSTGSDWRSAAMLANAAAGIVVGKVGTATATPAEVLRHYQDQEAL